MGDLLVVGTGFGRTATLSLDQALADPRMGPTDHLRLVTRARPPAALAGFGVVLWLRCHRRAASGHPTG